MDPSGTQEPVTRPDVGAATDTVPDAPLLALAPPAVSTPAPPATLVAPWRRPGVLPVVLAVAGCGLVMGAMLGSAALGVVHAAARGAGRGAAATTASLASAASAAARAPVAPAPEGEGDSEGQAPTMDVRQRALGAGGVLASTLSALGVDATQGAEIARALGRAVDVRSLRPTDTVVVMRDPAQANTLRRVLFRRSASAEWVLEPDEAGNFQLARVEEPDDAASPAPEPTPETAPSSPRERALPAVALAHAPSAPSPSPSRAPRRTSVSSDDVPEGPAVGYLDGRAMRIRVTRVDGKPVELSTAQAFRRMAAAARRAGLTLRVVSGFRTMEHQQALYRAYLRGRGNLAAVPGHSHHQSGHALDLNTSTPGVRAWLDRHAREYGFRRTVPSEAWHWERW